MGECEMGLREECWVYERSAKAAHRDVERTILKMKHMKQLNGGLKVGRHGTVGHQGPAIIFTTPAPSWGNDNPPPPFRSVIIFF